MHTSFTYNPYLYLVLSKQMIRNNRDRPLCMLGKTVTHGCKRQLRCYMHLSWYIQVPYKKVFLPAHIRTIRNTQDRHVYTAETNKMLIFSRDFKKP